MARKRPADEWAWYCLECHAHKGEVNEPWAWALAKYHYEKTGHEKIRVSMKGTGLVPIIKELKP